MSYIGKQSEGEARLALQLRAVKLDGWEREYRFHVKRRWRFDFAWPAVKLAVEIDGYGMNHYSVMGRTQDLEKQNEAVKEGWRVLRYTPAMVRSGVALKDIEATLRSEGEYTPKT